MDKFDQTCDCGVVHLTPADDVRFKSSQTNCLFAEFIRAAINRGTRSVTFAANCPDCKGTGMKQLIAA